MSEILESFIGVATALGLGALTRPAPTEGAPGVEVEIEILPSEGAVVRKSERSFLTRPWEAHHSTIFKVPPVTVRVKGKVTGGTAPFGVTIQLSDDAAKIDEKPFSGVPLNTEKYLDHTFTAEGVFILKGRFTGENPWGSAYKETAVLELALGYPPTVSVEPL